MKKKKQLLQSQEPTLFIEDSILSPAKQTV